MGKAKLVSHGQKYAEEMARLTSDPKIKNALGFTEEQTSVAGVSEFIDFITTQQFEHKQYSRLILNEQDELIGVITLKSINHTKKTAHVGTWISSDYWGMGYNEDAKEQIFSIAFEELKLEHVFAGATLQNIRSQKAQEKLPYMMLDVGNEYPRELQKIERETKQACMLNMVTKESFTKYLQTK